MRRALRREYRSAEVMELKAPTVVPGRLRRDGAVAYFASLPEAERARLRLIMGHMTFGLHEALPRPSTYVTLLREPLALIVSQYHHVRRHEGHILHEAAQEYPDLASYVRSGISLEMDNSQTRAFAGDSTTPFGGCTQAMLDRAKANLADAFSVVGLTERFDESLVLMERAFGWTKLRYVTVNVDPGRSRRPSLGRGGSRARARAERARPGALRVGRRAVQGDPRGVAGLRRGADRVPSPQRAVPAVSASSRRCPGTPRNGSPAADVSSTAADPVARDARNELRVPDQVPLP